ncbi:hypothetical protein [Streptomyces sp. NPDC096132]|uniref:hypothetical protein n=1 Tax=Streptomyces sp. NPDC096132 TaxID=3366075 RepID=UPI0038212F70
MSVHIVGIHGIWQGNTNKVELSADWSAALTKGLRTHHGSDCPVPPLDVAYYGDLFRSPSRHLGADDDAVLVKDTDPYTTDEQAFVVDTLSFYAPPGTDDDRFPRETLGPGLPYTPQPIARRLAALDRTMHRPWAACCCV